MQSTSFFLFFSPLFVFRTQQYTYDGVLYLSVYTVQKFIVKKVKIFNESFRYFLFGKRRNRHPPPAHTRLKSLHASPSPRVRPANNGLRRIRVVVVVGGARARVYRRTIITPNRRRRHAAAAAGLDDRSPFAARPTCAPAPCYYLFIYFF